MSPVSCIPSVPIHHSTCYHTNSDTIWICTCPEYPLRRSRLDSCTGRLVEGWVVASVTEPSGIALRITGKTIGIICSKCLLNIDTALCWTGTYLQVGLGLRCVRSPYRALVGRTCRDRHKSLHWRKSSADPNLTVPIVHVNTSRTATISHQNQTSSVTKLALYPTG